MAARSWRALALALAALASIDPAIAQAEDQPHGSGKHSGTDAVALPVISYSTDQGLGFGGVAGAYLYAPGYTPYRHAIGAQSFFSTRGGQNHLIRYDGPELLGQLRVEARLELRSERRSPYYGPGNRSATGFTGDLADTRYSYDRRSPSAWVRVRAHPVGRSHPLQLWVGYAYRRVRVGLHELSLLAEDSPAGVEGGQAGQVSAGALWDTRDDEANPARGGVAELAVRASGPPTASDYTFGGVTLSGRRYLPLGTEGGLVLAVRAVVDHQVGEVPFFEWPQVGGLTAAEGVGGVSSVRGVPRNRFSGNTKVFANAELRALPFGFPFWGQPVKLGGVVFADAGRVWHPDQADEPWYAWHPGVGAGLRAVRRAAVLRADGAVSLETFRPALYFTVGHLF
jgi:hypothetical protein